MLPADRAAANSSGHEQSRAFAAARLLLRGERMNKPFLIVSLLVTACAQDEIDDPIDGSFIDDGGKEDAFGIAEGSPEALGVLQLANTADHAALRDKVGLAETAVKAILAYRKREGIDTWFNPFDTLKELDDVPYIGSSAFSKLLAYADDNRYVTPNPFEPSACEGSAISLARLQELTQNGTAKLPTGATWVRSRQCSGPLGCGPWSTPRKLGEPKHSQLGYRAIGDKIAFEPDYRRSVSTLLPQGYLDNILQYHWSFLLTPGAPSSLGTASGYVYSWFGSNVSSQVNFDAPTVTFTDECMRAYAHFPQGNQYQPETEVVLMTTF
jgi:hypothetical protein